MSGGMFTGLDNAVTNGFSVLVTEQAMKYSGMMSLLVVSSVTIFLMIRGYQTLAGKREKTGSGLPRTPGCKAITAPLRPLAASVVCAGMIEVTNSWSSSAPPNAHIEGLGMGTVSDRVQWPWASNAWICPASLPQIQ